MAKVKVTAVQLADSLNKLADHFRSQGDVAVGTLSLFNYHCTKDSFVKAVQLMPRPLRKDYDGDDYRVIYEAPGIYIQTYAPRARVCTVVKPAVEAVYECEPLLSADEDAALLADQEV